MTHFDTEFQAARRNLGYPPIDRVEYNPNISHADLDFSRNEAKVAVNPLRFERLTPHARYGTFLHVLGHYRKHPYDAVTVLRELHWLRGHENPEFVRRHFDDVVNDLHLLRDGHAEQLAHAYREKGTGAVVHEIIKKFYEEVSDEDFGAQYHDLTEDQQAFLDELFKIDFLDRDNLKRNVRRFGRAFHDLIGDADPVMGNDYSMRGMNYSEIQRGMQQISDELTPGEYRDLAETVEEELGEEDVEAGSTDSGEGGDRTEGSGIGKGQGSLNRLSKADVSYYEILAADYALKIRGPETRRGGNYPAELADFTLGDSVADLDPVNSYGKIIPGVAKKWRREGYEVHGDAEDPPDALIALDASGSMPDPTEHRSSAVLGGFCAANAYLENGSSVAVLNYGDVTIHTDYTRDRDAVYDALCRYQGGGTTLDTSVLERLENRRRDLHTVIITDAGLDNYRDVENYFTRRDRDVSKTTLIWRSSPGFRGRFDRVGDHVTAYEVTDESDIPRIVLGEV